MPDKMTPRRDLEILKDTLDRDCLGLETAMKFLSILKDVDKNSEEEPTVVETDLTSPNTKCITPDICPLCGNAVKYFKMNYMEMVKMCSNMDCVYPFAEESFDIIPYSPQYSESIGISPGCSVQTSITSDQRSIADSGLGYGETDFEKDKFEKEKELSVEKPPIQSKADNENGEQNKIEVLLQSSSKLVSKLNKYKRKAKRKNLKNPFYIKQLLSIEKSMNTKTSLVTAKELEILNEYEKQKNNYKVDIQMPNETDAIPKIDITFG